MNHDVQQEIVDYIAKPCGNFADLVALQARAAPDRAAVVCEQATASYAELNAHADRIAAAL